jgi:hypothetical protein
MTPALRIGRILVLLFLVAATYPLALAAQTLIDALLGDGLLLGELRYGDSRRELALALFETWLASLYWVTGIWIALAALRKLLSRAYAPVIALALVALALGALSARAPVVLVTMAASAAALFEIGRRVALR